MAKIYNPLLQSCGEAHKAFAPHPDKTHRIRSLQFIKHWCVFAEAPSSWFSFLLSVAVEQRLTDEIQDREIQCEDVFCSSETCTTARRFRFSGSLLIPIVS